MFNLKIHFISLSLLLVLSISFLIIPVIVNSITYQDTTRNVTKILSDEVFQMFESSSLLCVISDSEDSSRLFIDSCQKHGIPYILNKSTNQLRFCNSIIFLEVRNFTRCLTVEFYKSSFYFLNFYSDIDFRQLERCLSNSTSSEVVVLHKGLIFELSRVFPPPRRLTLSSVAEVLQHRRGDLSLDLGGARVTVAFTAYPPFSIFPNFSDPETGDGIEFTLVQELSRQLNFTVKYQVYRYPWGLLMPNGTWHGKGLTKAIVEGRADMALANIWQIPSFYRILDFGPSLNRISIAFLVRRPVQIDFQWRAFMTIFQPLVWTCTLITFATMVFVYHMALEWDHRPRKHSWSASVLTVFGHFIMASSTPPPHSPSTRPLLTIWSAFSLILTTYLSTGIVVCLTLPLYTPRVDTHQQLVQQGFYWTFQSYKGYKTPEIRNMIFDFTNPWSREFEKRYVYMEKEEARKVVKLGKDKKVALIVQTYGDDFFIPPPQGWGDQNELAGFRRTKQVMQGCHVSWGVKKHSPLLRPLTVITHRFIQAALIKQWREQVVRRWPQHAVNRLLIELDIPTFGEPQPLKLKKVQPILYFLIFGMTIASVVFFLELIW